MILEIILWLLIVALLVNMYFFFRINKVYNLRVKINNMCYDWSTTHIHEESAYRWLYDELPSYDSMLYSFKPLTMEAWIKKEHYERLTNK